MFWLPICTPFMQHGFTVEQLYVFIQRLYIQKEQTSLLFQSMRTEALYSWDFIVSSQF